MSLIKNIIRPLAAVATAAVFLAGCAGQVPQEVQEAPQGPESYRLALAAVLTAGVLELSLVESVMPDGSTVSPDQDRVFRFVHVAGITAPEPGECGAAVSMTGAWRLINSLSDQAPDFGRAPQSNDDIPPTHQFEVPAADVDKIDKSNPTMNLSIGGMLFAQELVSAGLALDSDGRWAQEQASAQADGLGIWAECPVPYVP